MSMKYNEHIGIIYDVIYYGVIYFNRPSVIKKFEGQFNLDNAFTYFDEVKNSCYPLDDCLLPFFYYDTVTPSFLSEHFRIFLDFHKHKFKDFMTILENTFYKSAYGYLFPNLTENERKLVKNKNSEAVNKIFKNLQWSAEMKNQTLFFIYNFQYVFGLLIDTLTEIYNHITKLHEKYIDKIKQMIIETESKENLKLFEKLYKLKEDKINKQYFSMCFMNPFVINEKRQEEYEESMFLFGYRYKEMMEVTNSKKNISLKKSLSILGDSICFEIIMSIKKHGSLTMSDLNRLNDISKSTAFRNVNILFEERIIIEDYREGSKIYYKINYNRLRSIEKLFNEFSSEYK